MNAVIGSALAACVLPLLLSSSIDPASRRPAAAPCEAAIGYLDIILKDIPTGKVALASASSGGDILDCRNVRDYLTKKRIPYYPKAIPANKGLVIIRASTLMMLGRDEMALTTENKNHPSAKENGLQSTTIYRQHDGSWSIVAHGKIWSC